MRSCSSMNNAAVSPRAASPSPLGLGGPARGGEKVPLLSDATILRCHPQPYTSTHIPHLNSHSTPQPTSPIPLDTPPRLSTSPLHLTSHFTSCFAPHITHTPPHFTPDPTLHPLHTLFFSSTRLIANIPPHTLFLHCRWACEVADGMAYLHGSSTVHLDLKPENVRLSPQHALFAAHTPRSTHSPQHILPIACPPTHPPQLSWPQRTRQHRLPSFWSHRASSYQCR